MNLKEILKEASSLNQYGVSQGDIGRIHRALKLKHDVTYEPIRNKILAKSAISKEGRVIIAVNSAGEAFGIGPWKHEFSGAYLVMMTTPGKSGDVVTITDAFKAVSGPGWKYFVSTSSRASQDKYDRSVGYDYGDSFIKDVDKRHGTVIQKKAQEAFDAVSTYLTDMVVGIADIDKKTINSRDLDRIKEKLIILKRMATTDFSNSARYNSKGHEMMKTFFGQAYDYGLDRSIEMWKEDQQLATHKFAKFIIHEIDNMVQLAIDGKYTSSKKANDYRTDPDKFLSSYK